ncbi:hypothetical protein GQ600_20152 [Phytophthora cactorum]|nr:hypothetical protein GQ600_20152 [Phytophthora cactorum]
MEAVEPTASALKGGLTSRTWSSLKLHYGQIQKSIAKYVSCANKAETLRVSGATKRT